jgi:putative nucleotidyltransferase-like protein
VRDAELLLRRVLRGDTAAWPGGTSADEEQFFAACVRHGVALLVERQLRLAGALDGWPAAVRRRLRSAALELAAVTSQRDPQLVTVVDALAAAGVRALLIKGAALARTHYADAMLRPSGDVDVLVRPSDVETSRRALESAGYAQVNETRGRLVTYQSHFVRDDRLGIGLVVDVHWKINNPQLFADALTFDEMDPEAVPVPGLGPHARCPGPVHALFHAVVHRVAHANGGIGLLTLSDIHQLVTAMSEENLRRFARLAVEREMAAVALGGLLLAREWFGTRLAGPLVAELERGAALRREPSAAYLRPLRGIDVLMSDLAALESWGARTRLLREHMLPPADYMLRAYGASSRALLPALYAHRFVAGARRWFTRS